VRCRQTLTDGPRRIAESVLDAGAPESGRKTALENKVCAQFFCKALDLRSYFSGRKGAENRAERGNFVGSNLIGSKHLTV
jgi:hypothetical protein